MNNRNKICLSLILIYWPSLFKKSIQSVQYNSCDGLPTHRHNSIFILLPSIICHKGNPFWIYMLRRRFLLFGTSTLNNAVSSITFASFWSWDMISSWLFLNHNHFATTNIKTNIVLQFHHCYFEQQYLLNYLHF